MRGDDRPRLLALRALGLGDLLTAAPALRAIARGFPGHRRLVACPRWLAPLVELIGGFENVVATDCLGPLDVDGPVDVAVNLHGRGPESHAALLALGPRALLAYANPAVPASTSLPDWREGEHEVARWCRLVSSFGLDADPADLVVEPPPDRSLERFRGATLVHPGARSAARRWPAGRWAAVARHEALKGRRVVVTGDATEAELTERVARFAGLSPECVLTGQTDVSALASLVSIVGRVVCGDTGVGHLATALGTPSVLLFGPTSPAQWGPPPDRPWHRVLWAGWTGDPHGATVHEGLLAIRPADVIACLEELDRVVPMKRHLAHAIPDGQRSGRGVVGR